MPTYDLGDGVPLEQEVRDATGALTNATVVLTLTRPDGTTFPAPTVTNPSTGVYRAVPVPDQVGNNWVGAWTTSGAVTSVTPFWFSVADPAAPPYADLALVKSMLGKSTDDDRDDLILQAIASASRFIERRCGRVFWTTKTVSARTFPVHGRTTRVGWEQIVQVDDIATTTGLIIAVGRTGSYTTVTGIDAGPDNATAYGRPFTELRGVTGWLAMGWAIPGQRVQVTAQWGWPAVPDEITQATALLAARLYRRKDSPQGVLGSADWGMVRVSRTDPDVEALISPYIVPAFA